MTFKGILVAIVALSTHLSFSQTIEERIEKVYQRQHSTGQFYCMFPGLKQGKTEHVLGQYMKTHFQLADQEFYIEAYNNEKGKFNVALKNSSGVRVAAKVSRKNFLSFKLRKLNQVSKDFIKKVNVARFQCRFGMFYDIPLVIKDKKVHINVHPHPQYDFSRFTSKGVMAYNDDPEYKSYMLLDNYSYHQSANAKIFLNKTAVATPRNNYFEAPDFEVSNDVEIFAASAGHMFFQFERNQVEVTFTGGNINYCIANNSLFLIDGFLQYNPQGGELSIKYDLEALVAQEVGFIGPRFNDGFHNNTSFIVKKTFEMFPKKRISFHTDYFDYLVSQKFNYKKSYFSELQFNYIHGNFRKTKILKGTGSGKFSINIQFIED